MNQKNIFIQMRIWVGNRKKTTFEQDIRIIIYANEF